MPHYQCNAPVVGALRYKNDVVLIRDGRAVDSDHCQRATIKTFSRASRQRLAFVAANTATIFRTMITLTYPNEFPSDGKLVKRNLRAFLKFALHHLFPRPEDAERIAYLWFLEFQARGAPHIHMLLDAEMPAAFDHIRIIRERVAAAWYRIVGSDDQRHLFAGTRCEAIREQDGAAHYAVKYAHKMRQKAVPSDYQNVGRFWGHSRGVTPVPIEEISCREDDVRELLSDWAYLPDADRVLYRVLYGTSSQFQGRGRPYQLTHDTTAAK